MVTLDRLIFSKLLSPRLDLLFERLAVRNKMSYLDFLISFSVFCFRWFFVYAVTAKVIIFISATILVLIVEKIWRNIGEKYQCKVKLEVVMKRHDMI